MLDFEGHRFEFRKGQVFITSHYGVRWELKLEHDPDRPFTIFCVDKNAPRPSEES